MDGYLNSIAQSFQRNGNCSLCIFLFVSLLIKYHCPCVSSHQGTAHGASKKSFLRLDVRLDKFLCVETKTDLNINNL